MSEMVLLGDEAVAVNPDDPRYQHLIGKKLRLPLRNKEIPVIADSYVDREFVTGTLKIVLPAIVNIRAQIKITDVNMLRGSAKPYHCAAHIWC